ncbi:hypothetical protein A1O3_05433 [Capronia epimyces CBS 606.96]|uniref:Uncharacterized protein n=1 Tax=Capronia epimyces CBS 606.96 TaxID=1182542 RepID=W9Y6B2_9EURO|nr:uncharacterized protein A1O3_05433 [Capronia epimyces CBS 606.96]EXJ84761.1 hypothetical protein A1O3_05433 [Capronia epimyces CBS 606.96]
MDDTATREILDILSKAPPDEEDDERSPTSTSTSSLRQQAHELVSHGISIGTNDTNLDTLPNTLHDLLTRIIKPLFTSTKHPALTSTGRKNLVSSGPALAGATRFDDAAAKPWKSAPFTVPLLRYVLTCYACLPEAQRRATVEAHFFLLVPPVLNMIDDSDAAYKAAGCGLVRRLCEVLVSVRSEMLRRTGLADVFVDALRANFLLLPPLTPEDESLAVLRELYPAFLALVDARFVDLGLGTAAPKWQDTVAAATTATTTATATAAATTTSDTTVPTLVTTTPATKTGNAAEVRGVVVDTTTGGGADTRTGGSDAKQPILTTTTTIPSTSTPTSTHPQSKPQSSRRIQPAGQAPDSDQAREYKLRSSLLTALYRHGISASLSHLSSSASESLGSTTSTLLTTHLLAQIPPVFERLGIACVRHFQTLLPMLRLSLMDPFTLAAPPMVLAALDVLACVVVLGGPRVRDKWYPDILRGCVGCWCNCVDEIEVEGEGEGEREVEVEVDDAAKTTTTTNPTVNAKAKKAAQLQPVMARLKTLVAALRRVVPPDEWLDLHTRLLAEEGELADLFDATD